MLIEILTLGGIAASVSWLHKSFKESEERERIRQAEIERRKNSVCQFNDGVTKEEFEKTVYAICKRIKRIENVQINGPIVNIAVRAQSGISTWSFEIDYNDYGHLTGRYWLWTENDDSTIPKKVADEISSHIH